MNFNPDYTPNIEATQRAAALAESSNGPKLWERVSALKPGTYRIRLLPPLQPQLAAFGGAAYVPLVTWSFNISEPTAKDGVKFFTHTSEMSLGEGRIDSVSDWLTRQVNLETKRGFWDKTNENAEPIVVAYRNLLKGKFDKSLFKSTKPNRNGEAAMPVIFVQQDGDYAPYIDENGVAHSVAVDGASPVFLTLRYNDVKSFTEQVINKKPFGFVFRLKKGLDVLLTITEDTVGTTKTTKSSWDFPINEEGGLDLTDLYDWQDVMGRCPDIMAELASSCQPEECIKHMSKAMGLSNVHGGATNPPPASSPAPAAQPPVRRQALNTAIPGTPAVPTPPPGGGGIKHPTTPPPGARPPVTTPPPAAENSGFIEDVVEDNSDDV
jgi:hypothetical protein